MILIFETLPAMSEGIILSIMTPCKLRTALVLSSCSGDDPTVTNGTVTWCCAGLSIDLLEILKRRLEFDYDLFEVPDRTCGVKNQVNCIFIFSNISRFRMYIDI